MAHLQQIHTEQALLLLLLLLFSALVGAAEVGK
jgi:hypothetical protein